MLAFSISHCNYRMSPLTIRMTIAICYLQIGMDMKILLSKIKNELQNLSLAERITISLLFGCVVLLYTIHWLCFLVLEIQ